MKPVSSIFSGEGNRGQMAVVITVILAAFAIIATIALTGDSRKTAEAGSLSSPSQQVPQDPVSANTVFVKIFANGELIEGESIFQDRIDETWTDALEYNHSVVSQVDSGSQLATGRLTHNAIILTKRIDRSSPGLLQAMDNNSEIDLEIQFEKSTFEGDAIVYYSVETTGGRLTGIRKNAGLFGGDTETLSITYDSLTETHELFNIQTLVEIRNNS